MLNIEAGFTEIIGPEGPFNNYADCYIRPDHEGPCALTYSDGDGFHWIVLPSRADAVSTAVGACRYDIGGYTSVAVYPLSAAPQESEHYSDGLSWLFGDGYDQDEVSLPSGIAAITKCFMQELALRIAKHPKELVAIEWRDLERLLFEVFQELGFESELTRSGKDGGFDLKLRAEGKLYLVEAKHWSENKVGSGVIHKFIDVVVSSSAEGLILSTSGFTKDVIKARSKISESQVLLGNELKVISLCQTFLQKQSGLWTRAGGLREIFFSDLLNRPSV